MSLITFWNKQIKILDWADVGLIKLAVASFILMIAKLWTPLLSLDWYWYLAIFVLAYLRPIYRVYLK